MKQGDAPSMTLWLNLSTDSRPAGATSGCLDFSGSIVSIVSYCSSLHQFR